MSEIGKVIAAIGSAGLWRVLQTEGFRRRATNYHRWADDAIQVVTLQSSQWNGANTGRFRTNVGVHFPAVAASLGLPEMPRVPAESYCLVRGLWSGLDRWWSVDSRTDVQKSAEDLAVYVRDVVWPWLEKNQTLENAALTLEKQRPDGTGLWPAAAARLHLGERADARRLIEALVSLTEKSLALETDLGNVQILTAHLQRVRHWARENYLVQ